MAIPWPCGRCCLAQHSAEALSRTLKAGQSAFAVETPAQQQLFATLRFVTDGLPASVRGLLGPLALHERFVDADLLVVMAEAAAPARTRADIDGFLGALANAGVVRPRGQGVHELHPVLTGYLRAQGPVLEARARSGVAPGVCGLHRQLGRPDRAAPAT